MSAEQVLDQGRLIVFSAPSGTGKSTVAKLVMERLGSLEFSVSATTRQMRAGERDGVDYHFLSREEFEKKIAENGFIEHEFFFGNFYGTLLDKTIDAIKAGHNLLFDLDVKGALNLKRIFGDQALLVFLKPPSMEELARRLQARDSESAEALKSRLERAEMELSHAGEFDFVVVNDDLGRTVDAVATRIAEFLPQP
ncbi:MAG TPA: guanylate kinase [Chlorobaculum sp.]|uniref:Guanylate kinase n=1 Tax=Chlorobaculum tepidum (strain ATCC 49652 / DSM 12025 / NBRC 103806 / TLS) TaxID=194439 RepID=KGUA_CHLTE|nr:guanylate kinase [Chlorobaculum tepidum]Q8KFS5.1 RecName: Full=Guanylate kinase; AltName: Full=GMP kinase [Chlorobaculum tepidum TLS]AAM71493.1 guanylate kinase [Chlorobaculum tepidum TLS]HBU23721.1 guanylate kinase [Chlorobaculum sp.]